MAPPHGAYSLVTARAMRRVGIEALSANHAAVDGDARGVRPLDGWRAADFGEGLPVLQRYHFASARDELAFRALLGQPIVLYGHHQDLAGGLDILEDATRDVNALGAARWCSLGEIARTNFDTRLVGDTLHVRVFSRRVELTLPHGVSRISVEAPGHDAWENEVVECRSETSTLKAGFADRVAMFELEEERTIGLSLHDKDAVDPRSVPSPPRRAWPFVRRALTEGRDRLSPVLPR
jgi:hypothetical protein